MVCTIFNYIDIKIPKFVFGIFITGVIAEVVLVITNISNQLLLKTSPSQINQFRDLYDASKGSAFYIHLFAIYGMLLVAIGYFMLFLVKHRDTTYYRSVTRTMIISIIVVLTFNLFQLVSGAIYVDLTYISLIFVSFILYQVIFMKDMVYNLKVSGRGEILSNMREIYIITDEQKHVVLISPLLLEKYNRNSEDYIGSHLDKLLEDLRKDIVIYSGYDVEDTVDSTKDHYHLREKKFRLKGFSEFGYMILMYDETQVYGLLRELNRMSFIDYMTGLNNRNFMEKKLEELGSSSNIGAISLDLNGLKANNDYLGHERGDYLLKNLALKMKIVMDDYQNFYMARIGGDEFLIILIDTNEKTLKLIKDAILNECFDEDITKLISVSIGTAYSGDVIDIFKLVRLADKDMYDMKQQESKEYTKKVIAYAEMDDKYIR
jgi:diguanylate cyclase (GGDEF)-like protein